MPVDDLFKPEVWNNMLKTSQPASGTATPQSDDGLHEDMCTVLSIVKSMMEVAKNLTTPHLPTNTPLPPIVQLDTHRATPLQTKGASGCDTLTQGSQLGTLVRFLLCMQECGVDGAMGYKESLIKHMYGPDILHQVDDQALINASIPHGDVIRMKNESLEWYNKHGSSKRKHVEIESPPRATSSKVDLVFFSYGR